VVFGVLLVCQANVCRSPCAAALFEHRVGAMALAGSLAFGSAGVRPVPEAGWCRAARSYVRRRGGQPAREHLPRRLDVGLIESSDLLLAMSRRERAAIVRLVPTAAPRTFTLVEAAALASAVTDELRRPGSAGPYESSLVLSEPPRAGSTAGRLQWLVGEMNAARGLVPLSTEERRRRSRREPEPPNIDIVDAHNSRRALHRRTLPRLSQEVRRFSEAVQQVSEQRSRTAGSQA
jgi:protein-tyrosine phosphatase